MIYIGFIKCFNNLSAKNYLLQSMETGDTRAHAHISLVWRYTSIYAPKLRGLKWPDTRYCCMKWH